MHEVLELSDTRSAHDKKMWVWLGVLQTRQTGLAGLTALTAVLTYAASISGTTACHSLITAVYDT